MKYRCEKRRIRTPFFCVRSFLRSERTAATGCRGRIVCGILALSGAVRRKSDRNFRFGRRFRIFIRILSSRRHGALCIDPESPAEGRVGNPSFATRCRCRTREKGIPQTARRTESLLRRRGKGVRRPDRRGAGHRVGLCSCVVSASGRYVRRAIRCFRCVESGPVAAGWEAGVRSERRGGAPFVLARELPTCRVRRGRSGFVRERFVSDERSGESRSGPVGDGGPVARLSGLSRGMDASFGAENMPLSGWRSSDGVRQRAFVAVRTRTLLSVAGNRVSSGRQAAAGTLFPDRLFSCGPGHRFFRKSNGLGGRFVSTVARCPTGFVTATRFLSNVACRCGFPFGCLFAKENGCRLGNDRLPYRRFGRYRSERLSFLAAGGRACRSAAPLPCFGRAAVFHPESGLVRVFRRDIEIGVAVYAGKEVCIPPLPSLLFLKGNGCGKFESDARADFPQ